MKWRGDRMIRRREFISLLGGAAAWPVVARAQGSNPPVIGFLRDAPARGSEYLVAAFRRGLAEAGFVDGNNVLVELGFSEGKHERLVAKASEFADRPVALIMASATSATIAAARATPSVPIVFAFPADPVQLGIVKSINRPGTNATGISYLNTELVGKKSAYCAICCRSLRTWLCSSIRKDRMHRRPLPKSKRRWRHGRSRQGSCMLRHLPKSTMRLKSYPA